MTTTDIITKAGGVTAVARACGLTHPSVSVWRQVPPRHARTVAKLAGLHPNDIRPDLYDPPTGGTPAAVRAA